jgi:hypothetical protein
VKIDPQTVSEAENLLRDVLANAGLEFHMGRLVKMMNLPNNIGVTPQLALALAIRRLVRGAKP